MEEATTTGRLDGRVALVTGAGGALGSAFAHGLAAEGAAVAVADVDREAGEAVAASIAASGARAVFVHTDVAVEESARDSVETAVRELGRLDILVNNAALLSERLRRPFEEFSADEWALTMSVNVTGPAMMMKAGLSAMRAQHGGSIVNISSSTVFNGTPNLAPYVASKGALLALGRVAAREFGAHGIRVNTITPGLVDTRPSPTGVPPGHDASVAGRCLSRVEVPRDLVGAVVFLASDDSRFISGQTLNVDGGFNLH